MPTFLYGGSALPVKEDFVYLGIKLGQKLKSAAALDNSMAKARLSLHIMMRRCRDMGLHNVMVQANLFNTMVASVLNYGCVVWSPYHLACMRQKGWGASHPVEDLQTSFLRQSFQVPKSTTIAMMMNEARRTPLMHAWFEQTVTWWNKVVKRPDDDLVKCALRDSLTLANAGANIDNCWGAAFKRAVLQVDPEVEGLLDNMQALPHGNLLVRLRNAWQEHVWDINTKYHADRPALRANQESEGFKRATYRHWFCHHELDKGQGFAYHVQKPEQIRALATFRMGAHVLNIERQRHRVPRVPREQRFCTCCTAGVVEDEMHVFECPAWKSMLTCLGTLICLLPILPCIQ
jgi:hypothetical protein